MIILLDCDDVLAQFTQGVIDVLNAKCGYDFDINDVTDWDMAHSLGVSNNTIFGIAGEVDFCTNLNIMPGAQDGVEKLKSYGPVYIVTSPIWSSKTWQFERTRWLHEHFDIQASKVIQTSAKQLIRGDFFVDDRVSHVEAWQEENDDAWAFVLDVPWPRQQEVQDIHRCRNWDELLMHAQEAWERGR